MPVFYLGSLWALAGFPTSYCQCNIIVSAGSVPSFEGIGDSESDMIVILTST